MYIIVCKYIGMIIMMDHWVEVLENSIIISLEALTIGAAAQCTYALHHLQNEYYICFSRYDY